MSSPVRDNDALSRFEPDAESVTALAYYRLRRRRDDLYSYRGTAAIAKARHRLAARRARGDAREGPQSGPALLLRRGYTARHPEFNDLLA